MTELPSGFYSHTGSVYIPGPIVAVSDGHIAENPVERDIFAHMTQNNHFTCFSLIGLKNGIFLA